MKKLLLLVFLFTTACSNTEGYEPRPIKSLDSAQFSPILLPETVLHSANPLVTSKPTAKPTPKPTVKPKPKPRATVRPKMPTLQGTRHSAILGKASWYCSVSQPICHHSYPPGSYVAAACAKLRNAMGTWRGRVVRVQANGRSVNVKLVDWCGSKDKTIDLYYAPMRALGGSGVLTVRISW